MIRLFANANYDFIKWRRWAYGLTAAIIIPGFALFLVRGLNYSIEFTGGTLIQVQTAEPVGPERIRSALDAAGIRDAEIQQFGAANEYVIRARIGRADAVVEGSTETTAAAVDSALGRTLGPAPQHYKILRTEAVGPKVGRELQGEVLRPFALVMTFAIFTGTFSSIYIAAPLLMYIEKRWPGEDARGARALRPPGSVPLNPPPPSGSPEVRSKAAV